MGLNTCTCITTPTNLHSIPIFKPHIVEIEAATTYTQSLLHVPSPFSHAHLAFSRLHRKPRARMITSNCLLAQWSSATQLSSQTSRAQCQNYHFPSSPLEACRNGIISCFILYAGSSTSLSCSARSKRDVKTRLLADLAQDFCVPRQEICFD
jgi:hypothetical protein